MVAAVARKLSIDPAVILLETDRTVNAARLAAAHIYDQADEQQAKEAKAEHQPRR